MLLHAVVERHVIVLAPATERMQKKNRVRITCFNELLTRILKKENVAVMERVPNLEGVDNISIFLLDFGPDLSWHQSVLIVAVVKDWSCDETHGFT